MKDRPSGNGPTSVNTFWLRVAAETNFPTDNVGDALERYHKLQDEVAKAGQMLLTSQLIAERLSKKELLFLLHGQRLMSEKAGKKETADRLKRNFVALAQAEGQTMSRAYVEVMGNGHIIADEGTAAPAGDTATD